MGTALTPSALVVLHVVAPAAVGGLERVVHGLASGHQRRGHRVVVAAVLSPGPAEPPLLAALREAGVEVHVVRVPGRRYGRERAAIGDVCRTLLPDVVHTHGYRPDVVDAAVAARCGVPVVTTVHGFTGGGWKNRFYERLQLRAFHRFDAVVAVSHTLHDYLVLRGVPGARVRTIVNAWSQGEPPLSRAEARRTLGLPADGFRVGFVGRLTHEKGADVLVDAAALLPGEAAEFSFVGDGAERRRLERRAGTLGVGPRITWHGTVPGAGRLMRAFDVLAMSSRTEGTPMVLFEAMAAEVPIVVSAVGGIPDVVTEAEAVLVLPERPRDLADGLRAVALEPGVARARSAAALRRLHERFSETPWLVAYEALYANLAAHRRHG